VKKITVAVMVDGITTKGADGKDGWAPRPPEEMETLRQLVQSAVGFDAARGDTVTIESLEFMPLPEQGTVSERAGSGFLDAWAGRLAQLGVLGVIVLALIFFVLRPMLGRQPLPGLPELVGPRELLPDPRRMAAAHDILDLPAQTVNRIERLREVISSRGEDSAAVLRSWIESPESQKEPAGS
jgi:flagellar M-ring protein FliF